MAILDGNGSAVVVLPDYFEALNRDFRYQLTPVNALAPNLHITRKFSGNRFTIAGGAPGTEVSWQVTGIRKDPFTEKNRVQAEVEKAPEDKGRYLYPEALGKPRELGIDCAREQKRNEKKQEH